MYRVVSSIVIVVVIIIIRSRVYRYIYLISVSVTPPPSALVYIPKTIKNAKKKLKLDVIYSSRL